MMPCGVRCTRAQVRAEDLAGDQWLLCGAQSRGSGASLSGHDQEQCGRLPREPDSQQPVAVASAGHACCPPRLDGRSCPGNPPLNRLLLRLKWLPEDGMAQSPPHRPLPSAAVLQTPGLVAAHGG